MGGAGACEVDARVERSMSPSQQSEQKEWRSEFVGEWAGVRTCGVPNPGQLSLRGFSTPK